MRFLAALLLTCAPAALLAETIEAQPRVSEATLYPRGASVTREITLTAPAGQHELVIPGLPDIDPASLRVQAEGVRIGAVGLQTDRPRPVSDSSSPEVQAAEAAVKDARKALRDFDNQIALVRVDARAAEQKLGFLKDLASHAAPPADLAGWLDTIGAQITMALTQAQAAEEQAQAMQDQRDELKQAYDKAEAALAALGAPSDPGQVLVMAVESDGTPATIRFTSFTDEASWSPVYDLRLTTGDAPALTLERGLMVSQSSGEDWRGVTLTLSTARPSGQSTASQLSPWYPRVEEPYQYLPRDAAGEASVTFEAPAPMASADSAKAAPIAEAAEVQMMGTTVTYHYPTPVDLRSGADDLRLRLDEMALAPEIVAEAVPRRDSTAFLTARVKNASDHVLLAGPATLYADGAMVGTRDLAQTAEGDEMTLGFGPIHGITLERHVTSQSEGNRGLISKESAQDETALIKVRNLTGKDWPLRVVDQVPISTQDELRITWKADPSPTAEDPDGQRGLLHWDGTLSAGETKEITLTTEMRWPKNKELR